MTRPMRYRIPIAVAAICGGLLHIVSIAQVREEPYHGYRTDQARVVVEVDRGGPAERAGLKVGDRLLRIGGIEVRDRQALDARPRPKIGDTQSISVERAGRADELSLTASGLPPMKALAYLVSGLNFLVVCLLLGCAPMIPTAIAVAAPGIVFPGGDYDDVTWVLIPFALARATIKQAGSGSVEIATA